MKKKLGIIALVIVCLLIFVGNYIVSHQPTPTSEETETEEDIEADIEAADDSIVTPLTSEHSYQVKINNYLITLGQTTLGDACSYIGIPTDSLSQGEWNYKTVTKHIEDEEVMDEVTNYGYERVSVIEDGAETVSFLVMAYATEAPDDILSCTIWGVGVNSNSNYEMSNTEFDLASGYDELRVSFGEPVTTTYAEETDEEGNILSTTATWEAEWVKDYIRLDVKQFEDYRNMYIEVED